MQQWKRRRMKGYDYSQEGMYFITICCQKKENYFWTKDSFKNGGFKLTSEGKIVKEEIEKIESIYSNTRIHNYVIMPNHLHFILEVTKQGKDTSTIVNQTKGIISKRLGFSPWQASFHDHIIRGEKDYENMWNYIEANPGKWNEDKYYM